MQLPILISVPHAGTRIPPEVNGLCLLSQSDILTEYDAGSDTIYCSLEEHVTGFCTTDIARSLVDLNRAPDDIGGNGVIKSHTCRNVPVYRHFPDKNLVQQLLDRHYMPYHEKLSAAASTDTIKLGIDCHTMSAVGPPVSPDPGRERPLVCLSNANGTCRQEWLDSLATCLAAAFKEKIAINAPFRGGHIIRTHAAEIPWLQVEISQTEAYSDDFKKNCLLEGLHRFCHTLF